MSDRSNIVPEDIMNIINEFIDDSVINIDDETESNLGKDISIEVRMHNLELSSYIHSISLDALSKFLIEKGVIIDDEYKNDMYKIMVSDFDTIKGFAFRAKSLKDIINNKL